MDVCTLHADVRHTEKHAVRDDYSTNSARQGGDHQGVLAPKPHALIDRTSHLTLIRPPSVETSCECGLFYPVNVRAKVINDEEAHQLSVASGRMDPAIRSARTGSVTRMSNT